MSARIADMSQTISSTVRFLGVRVGCGRARGDVGWSDDPSRATAAPRAASAAPYAKVGPYAVGFTQD